MTDDNPPTPEKPKLRGRLIAAAGIGAAGLLAGAVLAVAQSSASAESSAADGRPADAPRGYDSRPPLGQGAGGAGGDPAQPMRPDEELLTGTTREKVLAAVQQRYPDATVQRIESDSDGVYEAHIVNDGQPLTVEVGKDFTITGTETAPPAGSGGAGPGGRPAAPPEQDEGGATDEESSYRQS